MVIAQRPSLSRVIQQEISWTADVKGAAMEASASDSDIPTSAAFNAPQSLAPSPHMPIYSWSTY